MFAYLLEGLTTVCDYNLPSISFKTKFRQNIIMNNIQNDEMTKFIRNFTQIILTIMPL